MIPKSTSFKRFIAPLVLSATVLACGGEDPQDAGNTGGTSSSGGTSASGGSSGSGGSGTFVITQPLLPWAVGNTWTYKVTEDGVASDKVTTIGALELVGGEGTNKDVMANKVVTEKKNATDKTVSWQAPEGATRIVRFREQSFSAKTGELELDESWSPAKIHVDWSPENLAAGMWLESYEETKLPVGDTPSMGSRRDAWSILAYDEEVTVPMGTFKAVVFQKAGNNDPKKYWYVQGVGKVKETGGQTEELESYTLVK